MIMTYRIDSLVGKIRCPIICITNNGQMEFENGVEAVKHPFDKRYCIESIDTDGGKVIVRLTENLSSGDISWSDSPSISLFDGA